jgi:protein-disulfide isomerase
MRRSTKFTFSALLVGASLAFAPISDPVRAQEKSVTADMILNDPGAPVAGNSRGDVTIVAFLDYNCPFCKQSAPALEKLVKTDGNIRLVYKDWPILTPASFHGAQLALAAKYQGKYEQVHHALMGIPGRKISKEKMTEVVRVSGVDIDRLNQDLKQHGAEILELLQRNLAQADALGLQGTPVYLIGPFKVAAALGYDEFKQVVADARARQ